MVYSNKMAGHSRWLKIPNQSEFMSGLIQKFIRQKSQQQKTHIISTSCQLKRQDQEIFWKNCNEKATNK